MKSSWIDISDTVWKKNKFTAVVVVLDRNRLWRCTVSQLKSLLSPTDGIVYRWCEGRGSFPPPGIVMSQEWALHETKTPCKLWMWINMQFSLPAGLNYVTTAWVQANIDNTAGECTVQMTCFLLFFSWLIDSLREDAGCSSATVITVHHHKYSSKSPHKQ